LAEKLIERMYPETAEQQKENNSQSSNQQEPTIKRQQSKPLASILKKPKDFGMQQQSADSLILNSLPNRLDELNDENNEPDLYMVSSK
jgi:hypothetical protein